MAKSGSPRIAMTAPDHYEVTYTINPWMQPDTWARDPKSANQTARAQWLALKSTLERIGFTVDVIPGVAGLPDMLFPANAAIIFERRAMLARFRYPQRTGEEAHFRRYLLDLHERGLLDEIAELSPGLNQEGAGDCIWDTKREVFWAGFGPRSDAWALSEVTNFFQRGVVALLLATEHYYHLDTCFKALPGGEILYFPGAFAERSAKLIVDMVASELLIAVTAEEAASFCLNIVELGRDLVMAPPPSRIRTILEERGYRCHEVDLSSFILSGGAAYCMTLRLDLLSSPHVDIAKEGETSCSPRISPTPL
ncbi:MAG: arginine deiminase-related protein [Alphaproteobacteria bacterium]